MSPNIGGVVGNEDGNITNDLNAAFICIRVQFIPLTEEYKLIESVTCYAFGKFLLRFSLRGLFTYFQSLWPPVP